MLSNSEGVKKFDEYIHGTPFILETDHNSLQYIDKSKFINNYSRIMRWAIWSYNNIE